MVSAIDSSFSQRHSAYWGRVVTVDPTVARGRHGGAVEAWPRLPMASSRKPLLDPLSAVLVPSQETSSRAPRFSATARRDFQHMA
jgi:hypothetical protein